MMVMKSEEGERLISSISLPRRISRTFRLLVVFSQILPLLLVDDGEDSGDRFTDRIAVEIESARVAAMVPFAPLVLFLRDVHIFPLPYESFNEAGTGSGFQPAV